MIKRWRWRAMVSACFKSQKTIIRPFSLLSISSTQRPPSIHYSPSDNCKNTVITKYSRNKQRSDKCSSLALKVSRFPENWCVLKCPGAGVCRHEARGVAADRDSVPANLTPFVRCFPDTDICWTIDTIVHNGHITRFKMYTIDCADRWLWTSADPHPPKFTWHDQTRLECALYNQNRHKF